MLIKNSNGLGDITIRNEVVAQLAGSVAVKCYGVVGMAAKDARDGVVSLLKGGNMTKGIKIYAENGGVVAELSIIVSYGTNIRTICRSVANRVRYTIGDIAGLKVNRVNIKIEGIRV